nr:hypothetical protein [Tanacetum cinerariifolium]
MTFEEGEVKFKTAWEQIESGVSKISKEEAAWHKRKGIRLEQEEVKKMKTSEEVPEEVKSSEEVSEEKIKEMIQLVPIEDVYVEALQVKHPIIDWMVHTEGQRAYWKITRLGGNSASYQFFTDLLKHLDRDDLNQLWSLVKETLCNRPLTSDKEMELWVELSKLYEPDNKDQLWTHTQNFMHAPVEWKLYDTCGVHHGEGSGTPTKPHHTPSPEAQSPSHTTYTSPTLPPVTTTSLPTVTPTETTPIRQYTQRARIAQSSALPTIADEPASPQRDVTSPVADEGSMQQTIPKLTALCTTLQRQLSELTAKFQAQEVEINRLKESVKMLEDREGVAATRSRDDAPIKGMSLDEGEAATERISDDSEEMTTVLTSMDATTVLASGVVDVPTGSGSIYTASTPVEEQVPTGSDVVPTASPVTATAIVVARELEEQLERDGQRRSEQIARDAEIARIHVEEELQMMIDGLDRNNETVAKYLQEYHQFASELPIERRIELISNLVKHQDHYAKVKDFKGMTFEEGEVKFKTAWEQIESGVSKISKEEAAWHKRKGIRLEQEEVKKMKTSEEVPEEVKSSEEVSEEKIKEMIQLVPIEDVYVEALQVKHPIIDWMVHTEGQRAYWKITRLKA